MAYLILTPLLFVSQLRFKVITLELFKAEEQFLL
jgi:hypothetical protein